jgi:hypothetical protein
MIRALSAALLLAAVSASAAPLALPSFETAARDLQMSVRNLRAASVKSLASDIGPRLDAMSWDLQRVQQDSSRLRGDLRFIMYRVNAAQSGRRDPNLGWDLQRFNQDLSAMARNSEFRLMDLRSLSAQAQKDPGLVAPAQRLVEAARWLKSETGWLIFDAGFDTSALMRAGYPMEGMDLDRNSRDLDQNSQELQSEAERLLAKVR